MNKKRVFSNSSYCRSAVLKDTIKTHLCFWHLGCFFWWIGGFGTILWIYLLLIHATEDVIGDKTLGYNETVTYLIFLLFCLGVKKVHKSNNSFLYENGEKKDRYKGEFWMLILFVTWFFMEWDLNSFGHDFKFFEFLGFGAVHRIPLQTYLTIWGASAVLGFTRFGELAELVAASFSGFPSFFKK